MTLKGVFAKYSAEVEDRLEEALELLQHDRKHRSPRRRHQLIEESSSDPGEGDGPRVSFIHAASLGSLAEA